MQNNDNELSSLKNLTDEELVVLCKESDEALTVLISRYIKVIWYKAHKMSSSYIDEDDLMQEGTLGLLNSIKYFNNEQGAKFSTFADICISNKMKTALQKSKKTDIPVENVFEDDLAAERVESPESILLKREDTEELYKKISLLLSKKEWEIFRLYIIGSTYEQMARQLNVSEKTVDNALQRVRRKLKSIWKADQLNM